MKPIRHTHVALSQLKTECPEHARILERLGIEYTDDEESMLSTLNQRMASADDKIALHWLLVSDAAYSDEAAEETGPAEIRTAASGEPVTKGRAGARSRH